MAARRVLVVDDSSTVRRVVERTLTQAGFEVLLATDGREGLEIASAKLPDLVLVDFVMPHMNGFQLCQALRGIANLAHVPIVLMSAKADRIAESFLAQTGCVDAITKPFPPEALLAVTTHALARPANPPSSHPITSPGSTEAPVDLRQTIEMDAAPEAQAQDDSAERTALARKVAARLANAVQDALPGEPMRADVLAERIAAAIAPDALLALAGEIADLVPGLRGESALEGRLDHVPLGDVLQMLQHQRQTGVLEIRRGERMVAVCMSGGTIDLALGRANQEEFLLGRYLLEEELIDRDDLARLTSDRAGPRMLLGTRLLKLGYISPEDLQRVLIRQTSELVYEALRWKQGTFRFERFATRPEATQARLGLPIGAILMEGLRRVDEWRLIEEQIRSWDEVLRPDHDAIASVDPDHLSREERLVLQAVDGERTVRDIAALVKMGSFEVSKILFQLLTSRLIRHRTG